MLVVLLLLSALSACSAQQQSITITTPSPAITSCPLGYYIFSNSACLPCPAGFFGNSNQSSSSYCSGACPVNYYSEAGASVCTACKPGYFSTNNAASSCTTPCPIRSYCYVNASAVSNFVPRPCSPGTYCPVTGLSSPISCPVGYFCRVASLSAPSSCTHGYNYSSYYGATTCNQCPPIASYNTPSISALFGSMSPFMDSKDVFMFSTFRSQSLTLPAITVVSTDAVILQCFTSSYSNSYNTNAVSNSYTNWGGTSFTYVNATILNSTITWKRLAIGQATCNNGDPIPVNYTYTLNGVTQTLYLDPNSISFDVSQITSSSLTLPANILTPGLSYAFAVNITGYALLNGVVVQGSACALAVVNALSSAPVAIISGGDQSVWFNELSEPVVLNASASYSPDFPSQPIQSFEWFCYIWVGSARYPNTPIKSCGAIEPWGYQSSAITLSPTFFAPYNTSLVYGFAVRVNKETMSPYIYITGTSALVTGSVSISVSVPTQGSTFMSITSQDIIVLSGSIPNSFLYSFAWSCSSSDVTKAIANSSAVLTIPAGVLNSGSSYQFKLIATLKSNSRIQIVNSTIITTVSAPLNGICSISPSSGVVLSTMFSIVCSGWQDVVSSLPLTYSFASISVASAQTLRDFQPTPNVSTYLSAGTPKVVLCTIKNKWGQTSTFQVFASVNNPVIATPAQVSTVVSSSLNTLSTAVQAASLDTASQIITPLVSILNSVSNTQTNSTDIAYRTSARSTIVDSVISISSKNATTSASLEQATSLISSVIATTSEVSQSVASKASSFASTSAAQALSTATAPFSASLSRSLMSLMNSALQASFAAFNTTSISQTVAADSSSINNNITSTCETLARAQLVNAVAGQTPSLLVSNEIVIGSARRSPSALLSSDSDIAIPAAGVSVQLPTESSSNSSLFKLLQHVTAYDVSAVIFKSNIYSAHQVAAGTAADNLQSTSTDAPLLSFTLFAMESFCPSGTNCSNPLAKGSSIPVLNLSSPIYLNLTRSNSGPDTNYTCRFWVPALNRWSGDGCYVHEHGPGYTVCACTHLTTFNLAKVFQPPVNIITAQDVLNFFNWDDIKAHPVPLLVTGALVALWILLTFCFCIIERSSRRHVSKPAVAISTPNTDPDHAVAKFETSPVLVRAPSATLKTHLRRHRRLSSLSPIENVGVPFDINVSSKPETGSVELVGHHSTFRMETKFLDTETDEPTTSRDVVVHVTPDTQSGESCFELEHYGFTLSDQDPSINFMHRFDEFDEVQSSKRHPSTPKVADDADEKKRFQVLLAKHLTAQKYRFSYAHSPQAAKAVHIELESDKEYRHENRVRCCFLYECLCCCQSWCLNVWPDWMFDLRIWLVSKHALAMNILVNHPYLSVYFHSPEDKFTTHQRLCVMMTVLFTFLAVNAMFFGQSAIDVSQDISIAIFSSLIVVPIGVICPMLFQQAARHRKSEESEDGVLAKLGVHRKATTHVCCAASTQLMVIGYVALSLWTAGMIFLVLVYGMQFDMRGNGSGRWLKACFISIGQDFFLNSIIVGSIKTFIFSLLGRRRVEHEKALRLQQQQMRTQSHVKYDELSIGDQAPVETPSTLTSLFASQTDEHGDIDDYVAWLNVSLVWVPMLGDEFEINRSLTDDVNIVNARKSVKVVSKNLAISILQSLFLGVTAPASQVQTTIVSDDLPSLDEEMKIKMHRNIDVSSLRQAARYIKFVDKEHMASVYQQQAGLTLQHQKWHDCMYASPLIYLTLNANAKRLKQRVAVFERLLKVDLCTALGISDSSRVRLISIRSSYRSSSNYESNDETSLGAVVCLQLMPSSLDFSAARFELDKLKKQHRMFNPLHWPGCPPYRMDAPEIEFDEDVVLIDIYLREKRRRDFVTSRRQEVMKRGGVAAPNIAALTEAQRLQPPRAPQLPYQGVLSEREFLARSAKQQFQQMASASGRSSPHTSGTSTPVTSVTRSYPAKAATSATTKAVVDEASVDVQDLLEDLLHRLTHKARSGTKTPVAPIANTQPAHLASALMQRLSLLSLQGSIQDVETNVQTPESELPIDPTWRDLVIKLRDLSTASQSILHTGALSCLIQRISIGPALDLQHRHEARIVARSTARWLVDLVVGNAHRAVHAPSTHSDSKPLPLPATIEPVTQDSKAMIPEPAILERPPLMRRTTPDADEVHQKEVAEQEKQVASVAESLSARQNILAKHEQVHPKFGGDLKKHFERIVKTNLTSATEADQPKSAEVTLQSNPLFQSQH